jgi:hypothetical protein
MLFGMQISRKLTLLAIPAVLVLASCSASGIPQDTELGESVDISDGKLAVTEIEKGSAEDIAELDLDELQGQTPYFVHYEAEFDEGADHYLQTKLWKGDASKGKATPVEIIMIGDQFDCTGLEESTGNKAEGCQLVMVERDATLESIAFGGAGKWAVSDK